MKTQGLLSIVITIIFLGIFFNIAFMPPARSAPRAVEIGEWQAKQALPQALAFHAAVIQGNFIYVSGGRNVDGLVNTVYAAAVNSDGTLGAWQPRTKLPVARLYQHAMVATTNYLYVIGGWDGSDSSAKVWRAPLQGNGEIGGWVDTGSSYPTPIYLHNAVIVGDYLYVLGGVKNRTERTNEVQYTLIDANGNLGNWQPGTALPPAAIYRAAAVASDDTIDTIYVTGGFDGSQAMNQVYHAKVTANGAIGAWQAQALPAARYYHQALLVDDRLVILGGTDGATETGTVYAAQLRSDGSLDQWTEERALPQTLQRFAAVTLKRSGGSFLNFVLGGQSVNEFRVQVYGSSVLWPTPTPVPPTPTTTPTTTPTPGIIVSLSNQPRDDVGHGKPITYTISYSNNRAAPLTNVMITNTIPQADKTPLAVKSISSNGQQQGDQIQWNIGNLANTDAGNVSYVVQLPDSFELPNVTPTAATPAPPAIVNSGAKVSWMVGGKTNTATSNATLNNAPYKLFFPFIFRNSVKPTANHTAETK